MKLEKRKKISCKLLGENISASRKYKKLKCQKSATQPTNKNYQESKR